MSKLNSYFKTGKLMFNDDVSYRARSIPSFNELSVYLPTNQFVVVIKQEKGLFLLYNNNVKSFIDTYKITDI